MKINALYYAAYAVVGVVGVAWLTRRLERDSGQSASYCVLKGLGQARRGPPLDRTLPSCRRPPIPLPPGGRTEF